VLAESPVGKHDQAEVTDIGARARSTLHLIEA
jgi:hypothetical protein